MRIYDSFFHVTLTHTTTHNTQAASVKIQTDVRFHDQPKDKDDTEYGMYCFFFFDVAFRRFCVCYQHILQHYKTHRTFNS